MRLFVNNEKGRPFRRVRRSAPPKMSEKMSEKNIFFGTIFFLLPPTFFFGPNLKKIEKKLEKSGKNNCRKKELDKKNRKIRKKVGKNVEKKSEKIIYPPHIIHII